MNFWVKGRWQACVELDVVATQTNNLAEAFFRALKYASTLLSRISSWRLDDLLYKLLHDVESHFLQAFVDDNGATQAKIFQVIQKLEQKSRSIAETPGRVICCDADEKLYFVHSSSALTEVPPQRRGYEVSLEKRTCTCLVQSALLCQHLRAAARFSNYELPLAATRVHSLIDSNDGADDIAVRHPDFGDDDGDGDVNAGVEIAHLASDRYVEEMKMLCSSVLADDGLSHREKLATLNRMKNMALAVKDSVTKSSKK